MQFSTTNLKEYTTEELKKYFIYVYQYSLKEIPNFKSKEDLNNFLDKVLDKYKNVTALDRLWYALYFETMLLLTKPFNTYTLDNSVRKTLNQISIIDKKFVETQMNLNYNLLSDEGLPTLIERPVIVMNENSNGCFAIMKKIGNDLVCSLEPYKSLFPDKNIPCYNLLGKEEVKAYQDTLNAIKELWFISSYKTLLIEISPVIDSAIEEENDNSKFDLLNYIDSEYEEDLEKTENSIFLYFDDESINTIVETSLKQIVKSKKDLNLLSPIFKQYYKQLIDEIFESSLSAKKNLIAVM